MPWFEFRTSYSLSIRVKVYVIYIELSIRHISTDEFAGTGSLARQFLGPHIPEQSVHHYYFRRRRIIGMGL
jgi:hypothetical protein